jgi:hypothetical protein
MISDSRTSSSVGPLYSPRSPVLRALLVTLIAGFVLLHEVCHRLFKGKFAAASVPADEANADLVRDTIW